MPRFAHGAATLVLAALTTTGCKGSDPLYCESNADCESGQICDVTGQFPASDGVDNTCIPDPGGPVDGGVEPDAGGDAGMDGDSPDAMPECSDTRPCTDPMTPVCDMTDRVCRGCEAHTECDSGVCGDDGACISAENILYVSPDGDDANDCEAPAAACETVQAAVDKLADNTHILAAPGTYEENVQIQDVAELHIVGPSATVSGNTNTDTPVFRVIDSVVSFDGMTISNAVGDDDADGIQCLRVDGTASISVTRVTVGPNAAGGVDATSCDVTMTASMVLGNEGGGIDGSGGSFEIVNNIIVVNGDSNTSSLGGARLDSNSPANIFKHNTIADNEAAGSNPSGVDCVLAATGVANIVYNNEGEQLSDACEFSYSDIEGGADVTKNNIDMAPEFVDDTNTDLTMRDYHLTAESACINAGSPADAPVDDIDGDPRDDGMPDVGADEYVP